ncbi:MAG: hypothetical protein R2828_34345 [Saprospiraceae bacterium]
MGDIFEGHNIEYKARIFGDEFKIIDDDYELYVSTFDPTNQYPMKKPRYSFEGEIKFGLKESLKEIHRITSKIIGENTGYCISIFPIEDDESVDIELRSVKYYELYEKMKKKTEANKG